MLPEKFPDNPTNHNCCRNAAVVRTLSARESLYYTWDDTVGKKVIQWNFPAAKVHNRKAINVTKVRRLDSC